MPLKTARRKRLFFYFCPSTKPPKHEPVPGHPFTLSQTRLLKRVLERYAVTVRKDSGIRNDLNDWPAEVGNERYILDLLLSVIRLSVETVDVVKGLPGVGF